VPHLTIEYSPGLEARADIPALCRTAYTAMVAAGVFPLAGIRVRAYRADHCVVADGLPENDFAALTLAVGAGRSTEALRQAGAAIFAAVQGALAAPLATQYFALSFEIRIINPDLNWKDTPIHARLSGKS
jgi:5-carboxymethyl-2-hydroxymuconate isomerase